MYTVRIHSQLEDRLDAEFYNPEALKTVQKIDGLGKTKRLGQIISDGYRVVYHGTDSINGIAEEKLLPFLSPTQIDDQGNIDFSSVDKLPLYYKDDYPKGLAVAGELLIEVKGNVSKVGVVPEEFPKYLMVSGSLYKASFNAETNSRYVLTFLKSKHGQVLKNRLTSNTIINYIAKDALYSIPLFVAETNVQKYIGDKVRQAERLRAWALNLEQYAKNVFQEDFQWDGTVLSVKPFNRLRVDELENRLDLKYNSPQRLAAIRHAKKVNAKLQPLDELVEISAMIGWKGLTTENYTTTGPWLLRGVEFSSGLIRTEDLVCVEEHKYLEQPQIHLKEGDIALTKDGTIGKAIVIPRLPNRIAAGSTVARLRKKATSDVDAYYLEFALAHEFVQCQIASFATGVAQPHITQEWIALLNIPRVKSESEIALAWQQHHISLNFAKHLTNAAKVLIEALIEGQLIEAELVAAEQALQAGSDQLDRRILNRLKTDGVDGRGPALFSDLDELYRLLAQAEVD
jgi:type I restriction enzyme S subunit